jgi:hypothetical protein
MARLRNQVAHFREPEEWVARARWDTACLIVFAVDVAIGGFVLFLLWRAVRG